MMEINKTFAITEFFKNIFPTLEIFKENVNKYLKWDYDVDDYEYIYKVLFAEFANSNIAYDTNEAFIRHFMFTLADHGELFNRRMTLVHELLSMDMDDLLRESINITNTANNNNNIVESPLSDIIPFISSQITSTGIINKGLAISRALSLYDKYLIEEFIDNFRKHFVCVFGNNMPIYDKRR